MLRLEVEGEDEGKKGERGACRGELWTNRSDGAGAPGLRLKTADRESQVVAKHCTTQAGTA